MRAALAYSECSTATRLKVGAIIVKNDAVISIGYNGTLPNRSNECEYREYMDRDAGGWLEPEEIEKTWPYAEPPDEHGYCRRYRTVTKPEVIHAEANALDKLARDRGGADGSYMFITHAPCLECSKRIANVGIRKVFFNQRYRDDSGIKFLEESGVEIQEVGIE